MNSNPDLHDFLIKHAKFPFPHLDADRDRLRTADSTDVSQFQIGLLQQQWKATHAVRDDALVQKLCQTLQTILGDTPLEPDTENYLLTSLSPLLQVNECGVQNGEWDSNLSEAQVV
jgi:hypothetical protein